LYHFRVIYTLQTSLSALVGALDSDFLILASLQLV